jgi:outer membrane protein
MGNADSQGYQRQFREIIDPVTGESSVGTVAVPFTNTTDTDAFWSYDAQLTQTVFRWDQWQRLKQADSQVALAEANYRAAQQDLMVRVAQRYFEVLAADDTLSAAQATLEAVNRQLEQAEKRFEVGLIAITDVQEARAAHDSATAGVIAAKRALASAHEFLRELTGEAYAQLVKPADEMPLDQPQPFDEQAWVDEALEKNLDVIAARLGVDVAKSNVKIAQAGHMPTLDFYARYGDSASDATSLTRVPKEFQDPNNPPREFPADLDRNDDQVGLRLNVPIFTGGVTRSQVREQTYLHRAERERLDGAIRGAERETRDAYLGVIAEKARVQALRQAVRSNQTALEATEAGFEVGTRTTVDVLDGRRRLFEAQRDYSRSRYDYLINLVRLKSAAGGPDRDQQLPDDPGPAAGGSAAGAAEVSSGATMATSRCTAPRLCATACRPRSPATRASAGSSSHWQTRSARSSRLRTMRSAPHCSSRSATSCAFCTCGPDSIGNASTAGSSRLCPPTGTRLPPTKATSAAA